MLRAFSASNAYFTPDEPSFKRVGGVGLLAQSRQIYVVPRRCTRPKAAKSALFKALRSAESRQSYSRCCHCWENAIDTTRCCHLPSYDTRCWRAGLGMCHVDLRQGAAAVIAVKPASALLQILLWHLVWVCGRAYVLCGGMTDSMGS